MIPAEDGVYSGITDVEYHADRGSLSSSGARDLLDPSCPAIFRHEQDQPPNPKPEYDFGHGAHKYVLGEGSDIVEIEYADWKTKAAQDARKTAWAEHKVPLLSKDVVKAKAMAAAVREHPVARALLDADGQPELSGYWTDPETGVRLRFRPDRLCQLRGRIICVDYKTSTNASPAHFSKQAANFGYFQQHPWYLDGLAAHDIIDVSFVFITQSKSAPYPVSVMQLRPEAVEFGRQRNRRAVDLYAKCVASDHWPAYGDGLSMVDLPRWAYNSQAGETDE